MNRPPFARRRRRGAEAGFTLIELVVVFAILGLALLMFLSRSRGPSPALTLRAAADQLAAGLRETRAAAIARNQATELQLDLARHRWRAPDGTDIPLPATASIRLVTLAGQFRGRDAGSIRFAPDGSSSGGEIELRDGNRRVDIAINWLTGRVTVADAP